MGRLRAAARPPGPFPRSSRSPKGQERRPSIDNRQIAFRLNNLLQTDIDAIRAYSQAIEAVADRRVRDQLAAFRGDHQRHVDELSDLVRRFGGTPHQGKDSMGFAIEGFTAITSSLGTAAALTAMRGNEELTNRAYDEALSHDLPAEARAVVLRGREDERRHRAWIQDELSRG